MSCLGDLQKGGCVTKLVERYDILPLLGCGRVLNAITGAIMSPNYPNEYPMNRECNWTITGHTHDVIELTFIIVDLEYSAACQ